MRRAIQEQRRALGNRAEAKARDERYIGDGANVPDARRAITMIAERAVVLMMVDNAEDERHAHVQQTHHGNHNARFHHAGAKFGVSRRESQVLCGSEVLVEFAREVRRSNHPA